MRYLILFICLSALFCKAYSQSNNMDYTTSNEDKIAIGKAYIDETFPDCDIEIYAPHNIFTSKKDSINEENLTKKTWTYLFSHEYELYIYYKKLVYEASLTPEERQLRNEADEKSRLEKEEYLSTKNK